MITARGKAALEKAKASVAKAAAKANEKARAAAVREAAVQANSAPLSDKEARTLAELRAEYPGQNAKDLRMAANRDKGLDLTLKQVQMWLDSQRGKSSEETKEVSGPPQPYLGAVAAEGPDERWQADLALMPLQNGKIGFFLVVDVFTRMAYAESVEDKSSATLRAFQEICKYTSVDKKKLTLSTDAAAEFHGVFRQWVEKEGIIWRERDLAAKNDIAVCDNAMARIKKSLKLYCGDDKMVNWPKFLSKAVHLGNVRATASVHGRPIDLHDGGPKAAIQEFMVQQDNARRFQQNDQIAARKEVQLHLAGGEFREPLRPETHSFNNRATSDHYGPVKTMAYMDKGRIHTKYNDNAPLKLVQIVSPYRGKMSKALLSDRIHKLPT